MALYREIALDTETTGLDPATGHRVVEIGCVEMVGRVRTGRHFHVYLNPERDMPAEAQRVHGLSEEFLADKPLFAEVAEDFLLFIGESPLVIHNASFDMKFLNAELARIGIDAIPMERSLDTVKIARQKFPGSPASLDALCKRFQIDLGARNLHGALLDAELLADMYLELMGGRQAALELAQEAAQSHDENGEYLAHHTVDFTYRSTTISAEEKTAHQAFSAALKQPIWAMWDTSDLESA